MRQWLKLNWMPYRKVQRAARVTGLLPLAWCEALDTCRPLPSTLERPPAALPPAAAGRLHEILQFVLELATTLSFLHQRGILHGDLKPDNVLLNREHRPVLIDFGLSVVMHGPARAGHPRDRRIAGTAEYLPVERALGHAQDEKSDLYSLGCLLYELLVGHPPFIGSSRTVVAQHIASTPVPPSRLVDGLPPQLDHIVGALLHKTSEARPSADELLRTLRPLRKRRVRGSLHRCDRTEGRLWSELMDRTGRNAHVEGRRSISTSRLEPT